VEHVERGDTTSDALRMAARGYLAPLRERGIDTLILGCTHYPLLSGLLRSELGPEVVLVSSAEETAKDVEAELGRGGALREDPAPPSARFCTTGDASRFRDLAELFLGSDVGDVEAVDVEAGARR
jgi:glutamate racemase